MDIVPADRHVGEVERSVNKTVKERLRSTVHGLPFTKSSAEENDDDTGTVDKLFEDLLNERNVDAFPCPEDIDPIVDLYEKESEVTYPLLGV